MWCVSIIAAHPHTYYKELIIIKITAFKNITLLTILILILTSCSKNTDNPIGIVDDIPLPVNDSYFTYPDKIRPAFNVDENGIVYTVTNNNESKIIENPQNTEWQFSFEFIAYDLNGNITAEHEVDYKSSEVFNITQIAVGGGKLYFSAYYLTGNEEIVIKSDTIYTFDMESNKSEEFHLPVTLELIYKLEYFDNKLYILGEHPEYDSVHTLMVYNIVTKDFEIIYKGLDSFSLTPSGNIMISDNDVDGNFFVEIDSKSLQMNEPKYIDIGITGDIASDGIGVFFNSTKTGGSFNSFSLGYASLDDGNTMVVVPDKNVIRHGRCITYKRGLCWFFSSGNVIDGTGENTLERFVVSDYIKESQEIKILSSLANALDDSFGGGYYIERTMVTDEELALYMLTKNKINDVFHVSTSEVTAHNVKEKGSFHPLNDVPCVKEYMDACFPFIREAATDDEGNIWMFPIVVRANCLVFHTENAAKSGLDIKNAKTPLDVMSFVSDAQKNEKKVNYYLNISDFISSCLLKTLRESDTLDTPEFRTFIESLREFMELGDLSVGVANTSEILYNPEILFMNYSPIGTFDRTARLANSEESDMFDVIPVTGTSGSPTAYCEFLVVNPYSDNLEAALDFISSAANHALTAKNSFMLSDPSTYTDSEYTRNLYKLYENSTIDFNLPNEIFNSIIFEYLNYKITIDEMVDKVNLTLNMYLNE